MKQPLFSPWAAVLLFVLAAAPLAAQTPAQRGGRGGGGPVAPGAGGTSGLRGAGGGASQFGGGGVPSSRRGGPGRIEKVSDAVEELYKQLDEKSLQEVPRREIAVVKSDEKVSTKLFRADPKLLEIKFVGTFTLVPAGFDPADDASVAKTQERIEYARDYQRLLQPPLSELVFWNGYFLFQRGRDYQRPESALQRHFNL